MNNLVKTAFKLAEMTNNLQKMLKLVSIKKQPMPEKQSDVSLVSNHAFSIDQSKTKH
jgi:hypothetical protein